VELGDQFTIGQTKTNFGVKTLHCF